jgi:MFS family permease
MLLFSARSGAFAQRVGAKIPLTIGPLVIALGMLMMTRIDADADYLTSVLPAVIVFGIGLTFVVAPVTATVLAAAESRHSGIASGINNAVSRVGGLLAVAVLPLIAGLTGDAFYDPAAMTDGFHTAMYVTAALSALGGLIAWATIESDVLGPEEPAEPITGEYSCDFNGPPVLPSHHEEGPAVSARLASGGPTPPASSP